MTRRASRGFTLVELLIVIVVIAILAAITIVAYGGVTSRAHTAVVKSDFSQASTFLEGYQATNGNYPTDQPTAVGAGLKADNGTTIAYSANAAYDQYCLAETGNGVTYSITSADKTPTIGDCTGLVGWWTFDGGSLNDMSGYNNTATDAGATTTTDQNGQANDAYSFDGTDTITCGSDVSLQPATSVTVSAWVRPTSFGQTANAGYDGILNFGVGGYWLELGASGGAGFYIGATGGTVNNSSGSTPTNAWYQIAGTYTSGNYTVYLNGVQVLNQTTATGTIVQYTGTGGVGCEIGAIKNTAGRYFIGSIDDVRVYNRVLSPTEIQNLYNAGAQ